MQVEDAASFVHLAYNPLLYTEPYLYTLPQGDTRYIDGFGFDAINEFAFFERFQRVILFKDVLVNARPYHAAIPLLPVSDSMINITAYPNPANNIITVMWLNTDDEWRVANIINREGSIVLTRQITNGAGSINIPVALLQKGLYFINLKGKNNKSYSIKFIKN